MRSIQQKTGGHSWCRSVPVRNDEAEDSDAVGYLQELALTCLRRPSLRPGDRQAAGCTLLAASGQQPGR